MAIAYLVNQYPKVSHSFIRREILALEALGLSVSRFAIRTCADELVDPADVQELEKTQVILARGVRGLISGFLRTALQQPLPLLRVMAIALQMGWRAHRLPQHLAYLAEACILQQHLAQQGITHLHAHFGTNSTSVAFLAHQLSGVPYSFTAHGPEEFDRPEALSLPQKICHAEFVVAVSSFGRSQLMRWCAAANWHKLQVVHCAVEDAFLSIPLTPPPAVPNLVCVGRLSEQKGHLLLLQAAARLAAEGLAFKLVLVGDGELRSPIETLIQDLHLQNHIEITGWASGATVQHHLLNSRALVLPSFAEGLPVVLMEALAVGRPVVSTYVAGIPELVEPGVTGWLVPAGCVDALTQTLRTVLSASPQDLQRMGAAGRQRVMQHHHALTEAQHLLHLLQPTASSPVPTPLHLLPAPLETASSKP